MPTNIFLPEFMIIVSLFVQALQLYVLSQFMNFSCRYHTDISNQIQQLESNIVSSGFVDNQMKEGQSTLKRRRMSR